MEDILNMKPGKLHANLMKGSFDADSKPVAIKEKKPSSKSTSNKDKEDIESIREIASAPRHVHTNDDEIKEFIA